jgi:hypothetical protein
MPSFTVPMRFGGQTVTKWHLLVIDPRVPPRLALVMLICGLLSCRAPTVESDQPLKIISVRVGIPIGPRQGDDDPGRSAEPLFKVGHWTPVVVTLAGTGQVEHAKLVVQTTDCDDVLNDVILSLPRLDFSIEKPQHKLLTFCRPGKSNASITVTIETPTTAVRSVAPEVVAMDFSSYLYVTLGPRLPNLRLPSYDNPRARYAEVGVWETPEDLPTRWLGYDAVDLAILNTSDAGFVSQILNDTDRKNALVEWVRRGGKLVVCVGKNYELFSSRDDLRDFLPVEFTGSRNIARGNVQWPGSAVLDDLGDPERQRSLQLTLMKFKPERNVRRLATLRPEDGSELPMVVQAAHGSGRVTIVATDPDQPPFSLWKRQGDFWERVLRNSGPKLAPPASTDGLVGPATNSSYARSLQTSLESFPQVPVISFSWVALLVLLYIVLIGPVDYLLLKRIFKRLEWTWVTFPVVVLLFSLGAYLVAYRLKGDDLRVQKVDLVDFDLVGHNATGWSWFSVFSPNRLDFDIRVDPSSKWGLTDRGSAPDIAALGEARMGRQSLFRRSYQFDLSDGSLHEVPISVWSVKSFQSRWHHKIDPSAQPLLTSLRLVGNDLTGSVTSHLPVKLERVTVFHRNHVYQLGGVASGQTVQVTPAARTSFREWLATQPITAPAPLEGRFTPWSRPPAPPPDPASQVIHSLLFHEFREAESAVASTPRNAGFRDIDQSWRLLSDDPGGSATIYAQTSFLQSSYRTVAQNEGSICHLVLNSNPREGKSEKDGSMSQESHLRFFVPVRMVR